MLECVQRNFTFRCDVLEISPQPFHESAFQQGDCAPLWPASLQGAVGMTPSWLESEHRRQ